MINIVDVDTAVEDLLAFISSDAMAISDDRLKALTSLRIILETRNTIVDQLRSAMNAQEKELSNLKREFVKMRNQYK
jgi:hypothetical protein